MANDVLVIAFDGLDEELIHKFGMENISQTEQGSIDNSTGISSIKTGELFASFITGTTYKQHKVTDKNKWVDEKKGRLIDFLTPELLRSNIRGFQRFRDVLISGLNVNMVTYSKEDLGEESLFEEIDNSRALFVPSYNPDIFMETGASRLPLKYGYGSDEVPEYYDTYEFSRRKRDLFREVNNYFDFLMCHFQRSGFHQHFYGGKQVNFEEERLEEMYHEMDDLAGKIIDFFEDDFDVIIFMSDHGLPTSDAHNERAFYSSNVELFGEETPKITDFHDKILELTKE